MKNLFKHSRTVLFLLFGILLPSSILLLTLYAVITGNIDLSLPDVFSFLFVMTVLLLNAGAIFTLWLTVTTAPFKFAYERIPCIGIGLVFSKDKSMSIGLMLPFIIVGIQNKV